MNFDPMPAVNDHSDILFWMIALPVMSVSRSSDSLPELVADAEQSGSRTCILMARYRADVQIPSKNIFAQQGRSKAAEEGEDGQTDGEEEAGDYGWRFLNVGWLLKVVQYQFLFGCLSCKLGIHRARPLSAVVSGHFTLDFVEFVTLYICTLYASYVVFLKSAPGLKMNVATYALRRLGNH